MTIYDRFNKELNGRDSRKVANNTYLERLDQNCIAMRLHNTYIVRATPEFVELNAKGWHTSTTKERMNRVAHIWSDKGEWIVSGHTYYDGIRLDAEGDYPLPNDEQPNIPTTFPFPAVTSFSGW
jgi:ketosteroid isomerase-like protein